MRARTALAFAFLLALTPAAQACTTLLLKAKDGAVVSGRTLEFGFDIKSDVIVIPAGTAMKGSLPNGATGISYTTKYGMLGANALGFPVIIDGINERGLFVSDLYFPGYAGYAEATPENAARAMASYEYGNWLLGNFATVDEVRAHLQDVVLVSTPVDALGGPPPLHFIVRDRSGKSLVIEPIEGKLKVYDDPLGVMTNSPTFDWHMTNLRNYLTLSAQNVPRSDYPTMLRCRRSAREAACSACRGIVRRRPGSCAPLPMRRQPCRQRQRPQPCCRSSTS